MPQTRQNRGFSCCVGSGFARGSRKPRRVVPRIGPEMSDEEVRSLRAENAELRRLLEKHQWGGLTPVKSIGACPECAGSRPPEGRGHRPGCAIAAALAALA